MLPMDCPAPARAGGLQSPDWSIVGRKGASSSSVASCPALSAAKSEAALYCDMMSTVCVVVVVVRWVKWY